MIACNLRVVVLQDLEALFGEDIHNANNNFHALLAHMSSRMNSGDLVADKIMSVCRQYADEVFEVLKGMKSHCPQRLNAMLLQPLSKNRTQDDYDLLHGEFPNTMYWTLFRVTAEYFLKNHIGQKFITFRVESAEEAQAFQLAKKADVEQKRAVRKAAVEQKEKDEASAREKANHVKKVTAGQKSKTKRVKQAIPPPSKQAKEPMAVHASNKVKTAVVPSSKQSKKKGCGRGGNRQPVWVFSVDHTVCTSHRYQCVMDNVFGVERSQTEQQRKAKEKAAKGKGKKRNSKKRNTLNVTVTFHKSVSKRKV